MTRMTMEDIDKFNHVYITSFTNPSPANTEAFETILTAYILRGHFSLDEAAIMRDVKHKET